MAVENAFKAVSFSKLFLVLYIPGSTEGGHGQTKQTQRQIAVMSCSAAATGMARHWGKHSRGLDIS